MLFYLSQGLVDAAVTVIVIVFCIVVPLSAASGALCTAPLIQQGLHDWNVLCINLLCVLLFLSF